MTDLTGSNLFTKPNITIKSSISISDILEDIVITLTNSKYKNSFLLKGAFVLMFALKQFNSTHLVRKTEDLDMNFIGLEEWKVFVKDLPELLTEASKIDLKYELLTEPLIRERETFTSGSVQLHVSRGTYSQDIKLDMNIKELMIPQRYRLATLEFTGASVYTMLIDKLTVLSSAQMRRRMKDLYDVYAISKTFDIDIYDFVGSYNRLAREFYGPPYILDTSRISEIQQTYSKVSKYLNNTDFNELYTSVSYFTTPIYEIVLTGNASVIKWNHEEGVWL